MIMKKHVYTHNVILYIHAHTHKMAKMANGLGAATNVVTLPYSPTDYIGPLQDATQRHYEPVRLALFLDLG